MQSGPHALYDYVKLLLQCGAVMAHVSLRFVKGIWLSTAAALLGGIYYLAWHIDAHWLWAVPYGVVAIIPVVVLTYYHWMLTSLVQAPEDLESVRDILIRFQKEHPEETKEVLKHKITAIGRWKTYKLIGKIVKDILKGAGDAGTVLGHLKILSSMANPAFWIILVISLILALVFSSCMIALIIGLLIFG